jgi:multimeric flavodoxin WrbA
MLVAALNGSPRRSGNTALLLDRALDGARSEGAETVRVDVAFLDIEGCRECERCRDEGRCAVDDDMSVVFDVLQRADALIVGTPIFFSGPTSQLKTAIDRCQSIWLNPPGRKGRKAAIIAVGADPHATFRNAVSEIRSFLNTAGFTSEEDLLITGVFGKGDILSKKEEMEDAYRIGRSLAIP